MRLQNGIHPRRGVFQTLLAAITVMALCTASGCLGTKNAYKAASENGPADFAYAIAEHYSALVKEAADLKEKGTAPASAIAAMQRADQVGKPVILRLRGLADSYKAVDSAENAAALQAAINEAILRVADLLSAVKTGRAAQPTAAEPVLRFTLQVQA